MDRIAALNEILGIAIQTGKLLHPHPPDQRCVFAARQCRSEAVGGMPALVRIL